MVNIGFWKAKRVSAYYLKCLNGMAYKPANGKKSITSLTSSNHLLNTQRCVVEKITPPFLLIMELNCHLQEMQKQPGMGTVARVLHSEMHKRFDRYIDPCVDLFDGFHIVSTLLDPQYSLILSNEQLDEGICYLKELVKYFVDTQVQSHGKTRDQKDITTQENTKELVIEPPLKKFRHLSKLVSKQNIEIASTTSEEQEEIFHSTKKEQPSRCDGCFGLLGQIRVTISNTLYISM